MGRAILPVLLFLFLSCGRELHVLVTTVEPGAAHVDAGHPGLVYVDAGRLPEPNHCTVAFTGPGCCGSDGRRLTSATCQDNAYVCSEGAICSCAGQPQDFYCSDFCGSDAYVEPTCGSAGWLCPGGLISTASCPRGTCWGDPGGACAAPQCVDGRWVCEQDDGGINDPAG